MRTKFRRITSLLLVAFMIISMFAVAGVSAEEYATEAESVDGNWVSAWSTSSISATLSGRFLSRLGVPVYNVTSRVSIQPTMSGSYLRLVFSNEYGTSPLHIGACSVAVSKASTRSIETKTAVKVLFNGKSKTDIPAGEKLVSDPVKLDVVAGKNISVSTYYEGINVMKTIGLIGGHSYVVPGNQTRKESLTTIDLAVHADSGAYEIIPSLDEIDVLSDDPSAQTCVIFGDSTVSNEVPRYLAEILRKDGINNISVTQAAIKGNRLVADGVGTVANIVGEACVKRFEKDVLSQAGVKSVIVKIGANDVVHPYCESKKDLLKPVSIDEMVEGYKTLVKMAHEKGVKIYFCEVTPWKGYTRNLFNKGDDVFWNMEIDKLRLDINKWFASDDNPADGFITFTQMEDESDHYALLKRFTTDGIHYTDEGARKVAELIPAGLFAN